MGLATIDDLERSLRDADYLPDRGLATALFLSLRLEKPLLLEGEAGVGKTEAAKALARALPARLIRLQCYEGLDVAHAVYEWNYSRQLLHIRAAQEGTVDEEELFGPEFLIRRPLLEAIESEQPVVLLIDEIDRADEEFEAFLLEVLSDFQITIPEIGTISAVRRPSVILTSNRTRELHDALKRRCLFHWIGHPALEREIEIVVLRVPGIPERLATQAARFVRGLRGLDLAKPPGVAETIDWAQALAALGRDDLDAEIVQQTLGSVLKYHEDLETVRDAALATLVEEARARWLDGARQERRRLAGRRSGMSGSALVRQVVTFGRVLREAGLEVGPGRISDAMKGLDAIDLGRRDDVYWTLRQTLVSRADDIDAFDRAFAAWFLRAPELAPPRTPRVERVRATKVSSRDGAEETTAAAEGDDRQAGWSAQELLREKDFSELTDEELTRIRRLIAELASARPQRRSRRLRRNPNGTTLDLRRLVRASLATGGDPVERAFRSRVETHRKLIVLCDVSGSMEPYSRAILHVRARAARERPRCRGVRVRHPPDPPDRGTARRRPGAGARGGRRGAWSTGRAARGSARR